MNRLIMGATAMVALAAPLRTMPAQDSLTTGTVLVYTTPDGGSREWRVEEASHGVAHDGRSGCTRLRYAAGGPSAGPEERITCIEGNRLWRWLASSGGWQLARPLGPTDSLDVALRSGLARYLTGVTGIDTVGGVPVAVVATVVLTMDSTGTVIRRLHERFAPGLGTATWGRFEVPEATSASGWRTAQEFRMTAIRRP